MMTRMGKPIVIGLDFDGVVAYNPARLARLPISLVKRSLLKIPQVSFFVPKTPLQRLLWAAGHETSVFPALGTGLLRRLTKEGVIEAHLVTGRFGFLEAGLLRFLRRWGLADTFASVTINNREEQPHRFKERVIRTKKFDYYIEDNWDIVNHLYTQKLSTRVYWIYNLFDRGKAYPLKFPYLAKSLEHIVGLDKIKA